MAHAARFGHVQMKAIFFLLLLAGSEGVRVTQEVKWGKSKWNELHEDCTWSLKGCKGDGCKWKRLPLDMTPSASCRHTDAYLLEHGGLKNFNTMLKLFEEKSAKYGKHCQHASVLNLKCKRRAAQMLDAFKLIARAPVDEKFQSQLDEHQVVAVQEAFGKILKNILPADEDGQLVQELLRKMKGHGPELRKDPNEAMANVMELMRKLLEGSPEEKQAAKDEVLAMPDTVPALSSEEEVQADIKLAEMKKEFEENRGDIAMALDQVEQKTDEAIEAEGNDTEVSFLETDFHDAVDYYDDEYDPDRRGPMTDREIAIKVAKDMTPPVITMLAMVVGLTILAGPQALGGAAAAIMFAYPLYALISMVFCMPFSGKGFTQCLRYALGLPVHAVRLVLKGTWKLTKGLFRGVKKAYRRVRGNASSEDPTPESKTQSG